MIYARWCCIALAACLAGCVAPQSRYATASTEAVEKEREAQKKVAVQTEATRTTRLLKVAYPLWTKNADLCGTKVSHRLWLNTTSASELAKNKEFGATIKKLFQVSDRQTVTLVVPGSPVDLAGVKSGDVLVQINGKDLPAGALTETVWTGLAGTDRQAPVTFTLQRGTEQITAVATPVKSCTYGINYVKQDALNAFADGQAVYVTSGMMRFTENDDELALVLGHELAHNARGHLEAKKANAMGGLFFDILAAAVGVNTQGAFSNAAGATYSREFESEADYVGLYYAARAGFAYAQGPTFWRRMAAENPGAIRGSYGASHPSTPERFAGLERTASEINEKTGSGSELLPNEKGR